MHISKFVFKMMTKALAREACAPLCAYITQVQSRYISLSGPLPLHISQSKVARHRNTSYEFQYIHILTEQEMENKGPAEGKVGEGAESAIHPHIECF